MANQDVQQAGGEIKPSGRKPQSIYVLYSPLTTFSKVGISGDKFVRQKKLGCAHGDDLVLHYAEDMELGYAQAVEKVVKQILSDHQQNGEWYDIDPQRMISTISKAKSIINLLLKKISPVEIEVNRYIHVYPSFKWGIAKMVFHASIMLDKHFVAVVATLSMLIFAPVTFIFGNLMFFMYQNSITDKALWVISITTAALSIIGVLFIPKILLGISKIRDDAMGKST
jgi:hypothetical protein